MGDKQVERRKTTILDLQRMKRQGRKITMLSIADYPMALLADRAGLDTIPRRRFAGHDCPGLRDNRFRDPGRDAPPQQGRKRARRKYALVVGDMPFMSNNTSERDAIINAGRFMQEGGTDSVKVEGRSPTRHTSSGRL